LFELSIAVLVWALCDFLRLLMFVVMGLDCL
jgi:hypothetical protein